VPALSKAATGIRGLDEITAGGLPQGRPTLLCGGPGCGKTLLAAEFLIRGAMQFGEPGVFMSFEETAADLHANIASIGFDLQALIAANLVRVDYVRVERSEIEEVGDYDLEGLFVRLDYAIQKIGARRVVLDTIESLFAGLNNAAVLRAELRRLFRWLKDRGVTAIITGERGAGTLTRQGLEEYVSDCVIVLDHRVTDQISTRRLRIIKYRGSHHGTNEYPFLIDNTGFTVVPITSAALDHPAPEELISSGIPELDEMLGKHGFFRGSSVLISGAAGTGKTSLTAHTMAAACQRGERVLMFSLEESPAQVTRNMLSIGIDLRPYREAGQLRFVAARPALYGLESHLAHALRHIEDFKPHLVVVDPVTAMLSAAVEDDVQVMLTRLIDILKRVGATAVLTGLISGDSETSGVNISSLIDTWITVRALEQNGERTRGLYVLKSRGMGHSNQIREFLITDQGIRLLPAYLGPEGPVTGSARVQQDARARAAAVMRKQEIESKRRRVERKRTASEAQIAMLQAELEAEIAEFEHLLRDEEARTTLAFQATQELTRSRNSANRNLVPTMNDAERNGSPAETLAPSKRSRSPR
jgi:circadian clock protein KaiC